MSFSEFDKSWCSKVLNDLNKWPITSPFRQPVDPVRDNAPNYPQIVTNPMDFSTMRKKLNNNEYTSVQEFIDDIQLICDNAKKFNGETSMYALICDDIMAEVHRQYSEKATTQDEEWYKLLAQSVTKLQEHIKDAPTDIAPIESPEKPPEFERSKLSTEQISQIEGLLGFDKIDTLLIRWPFLNDATRKKIKTILEPDQSAEVPQEVKSEPIVAA